MVKVSVPIRHVRYGRFSAIIPPQKNLSCWGCSSSPPLKGSISTPLERLHMIVGFEPSWPSALSVHHVMCYLIMPLHHSSHLHRRHFSCLHHKGAVDDSVIHFLRGAENSGGYALGELNRIVPTNE